MSKNLIKKAYQADTQAYKEGGETVVLLKARKQLRYIANVQMYCSLGESH